jgi:hypothetical protein
METTVVSDLKHMFSKLEAKAMAFRIPKAVARRQIADLLALGMLAGGGVAPKDPASSSILEDFAGRVQLTPQMTQHDCRQM